MASKADLIQRKGRWYFNRAYPLDLWPVTGRSPFRKALGTDSLETARREKPNAERLYWAKVDAARTTLAKERPRVLTEIGAVGLVASWFTERDTDLAEQRFAPTLDPYALDAELADLSEQEGDARQAIAEDERREVDHVARRLMAEAGLTVARKAPAYVALQRWLLRARLELIRRDRARALGDFGVSISDPLLAQVLHKPVASVVRTVGEMIDGYVGDKQGAWAPSTRVAAASALRVLRETLGETHDVALINRDDGRRIFDTVKGLPRNARKLATLRGLSLADSVAKGAELGLPTISPKTVNDSYISFIGSAFTWAIREGWLGSNPVEALSVADTVDAADKRAPFTMPQLRKLFTIGPYADPDAGRSGNTLRYWGPLIGLWQGMRRGEIAQLRTADVGLLEGVPVIHVRPGTDGQRVKTRASRRILPVHPALLALGFASFVAEQREAGHAQLFPLERPDTKGQWGDGFGDWFQRLLAANGIAGTKLGFHSFRHNFEDRLRAAGLHGTAIGRELAGRSSGGDVSADYGSGYPVAALRKAMLKVRYAELDLGHLARD